MRVRNATICDTFAAVSTAAPGRARPEEHPKLVPSLDRAARKTENRDLRGRRERENSAKTRVSKKLRGCVLVSAGGLLAAERPLVRPLATLAERQRRRQSVRAFEERDPSSPAYSEKRAWAHTSVRKYGSGSINDRATAGNFK